MTMDKENGSGQSKVRGKSISLLQELNNDPQQFSRVMEILNNHLGGQDEDSCHEDDALQNSTTIDGKRKSNLAQSLQIKKNNKSGTNLSMGSLQSQLLNNKIVEVSDDSSQLTDSDLEDMDDETSGLGAH